MTLLRRRRTDAALVSRGLWVGSAPDRRSASLLVDQGIDAVVDLRSERPAGERVWPASVEIRQIPLVDHSAPTQHDLATAAATVLELVSSGREVLVHCHAGLERAPTVACAALVLSGWSLADAFAQVTTSRAGCRPTEGQTQALYEFAQARRPGHPPHRLRVNRPPWSSAGAVVLRRCPSPALRGRPPNAPRAAQ